MWQSSMRSSIHSWVSSASCSRPPSLEQNSASERTQEIASVVAKTNAGNFSVVMPEGEDDVGDIGVVDIWAADRVVTIDCVIEGLCTPAFGKEWDERISM